uniref:Sorting nexin-27 n=1 Tax=Cacopsylla melanoneura TaxID=428564 RepID=A0A8D8YPN4_9HEMI
MIQIGRASCRGREKIMLPDRELITVQVRKTATADEVYACTVPKLGLQSPSSAVYFYLFEIVEYSFERKLESNEFPHHLYIQNYSTASATCLCVRKWLFSAPLESRLTASDDRLATFMFWMSIDAVDRGTIRAEDRLYELKALQDASRKHEYLKLATSLPGYEELQFPHCASDSRKTGGHVIPTVSMGGFKLLAASDEGVLENQAVEFDWDTITQYEVDEECGAFVMQYTRPNRSPRCIKIFSTYSVFLKECFDRIREEKSWTRD